MGQPLPLLRWHPGRWPLVCRTLFPQLLPAPFLQNSIEKKRPQETFVPVQDKLMVCCCFLLPLADTCTVSLPPRTLTRSRKKPDRSTSCPLFAGQCCLLWKAGSEKFTEETPPSRPPSESMKQLPRAPSTPAPSQCTPIPSVCGSSGHCSYMDRVCT